ncbi:MAG: hypothetical protein KDC44_22295, partial [Phaeodactylibacter sp.]|nr:hypothetical protein [Phaeodactylibacter sp.]
MSSTIHALHRLRQLLKEDAPLLQTGLGPTQLLSTYKPFQAAVTAIDRLSPTASFPGHGLIIVPPAFSLYLALVPIARALQQGSRVTVLMPDAQQSEGFRQWLGATFSSETITLAVDPSAVWTALSGGAFDWLHFSGLPADWALWQDLIPSNCGYRSVLYEQAIAVIDETANLDAVSSRLVWAETDPVHPFPEPQQLFIQESIKKHCLDRIQEKLQQFHHPEIDPERVFRIRGFRSLGEVLQAAAEFQYPAL